MHHSTTADFLEDFGGGFVAKDFPRSCIDFLLDGIDILLSDMAHVGVSWQIPSNNPVCVLNPSFLPGRIWVTEVCFDTIG